MDMIVQDATALTAVENRDGRLYKREDLFRHPASGVNGSKYRVCEHLIEKAVARGAEHIVSASSVLSPQAAMAGVVSERYGVECTLVLGATRPETAIKHRSVEIAVKAGAWLDTSSRVAYNPVIQRAGAALTASLGPSAWQLPYGITTPADASKEDLRAFLEVGAAQVANLPDETETIVLAFGSGNTTAGMLYGLATLGAPAALQRVVLVGVGPDRLKWLGERLKQVGVYIDDLLNFVEIQHLPLHGWFADYGDKMPETVDDIVLHPTYEGKVARYLNSAKPEWWTRRDGTTCFWIVGGPI